MLFFSAYNNNKNTLDKEADGKYFATLLAHNQDYGFCTLTFRYIDVYGIWYTQKHYIYIILL